MIDIDQANQTAVERIMAARPMLTGVARARDVIPHMRDNLLLHAGPPITWERMSGPLRGASFRCLIQPQVVGQFRRVPFFGLRHEGIGDPPVCLVGGSPEETVRDLAQHLVEHFVREARDAFQGGALVRRVGGEALSGGPHASTSTYWIATRPRGSLSRDSRTTPTVVASNPGPARSASSERTAERARLWAVSA